MKILDVVFYRGLLHIFKENFVNNYYPNNITVLDVRKTTEYDSEHIEHNNVSNLPLAEISTNHKELNKDNDYFIHCRGGYRSVIFSSILKQKGFKNPINVKGGFDEIKTQKNISLTAFVCPTTL